jgi:ABC-2 type transport system permease protein
MNTGTLEQSHLSPLPAWLLSVGRLGAALVEGLVITGLLVAGLVLMLGIELPYRWQALLPACLTVLDIAGFALLLAGLALAVTSIGAVLHVLQNVIMILNGSLVPVALFPAWLAVIARLLPSTLGVEATRKMLLQGQSLAVAWSDHSLLWLLLHTMGMLVAGSTVYQWNIRQALRNGRLGP